MEFFLSAVINGILMGSVYGVTAVGLTLIFGVMKVINFAHGSFLMVSMFASYFLVSLTGVNPYLGLVVVVPFCFAFGYFSQAFLIKPIFKMEKGVREPISVLLITTGFMMILDNLALLFFGADIKSVHTGYWGASYKWGPVLVSVPRLYAFLGALIGSSVFFIFLRKTRAGRAIRATGQDRDAAGLMGINVYQIYNIAFALGIAMTGLAGGLLVPFFYIHPSVGFPFTMKAFIIVILGGLGSIPGAILGGIVVALIESVGAQFIQSTWTATISYIIFIVVLFFKPEGILGFKGEW
jgi:branched-chain amino acid transport system permease protein